jgi:uncharacterized membrane protein
MFATCQHRADWPYLAGIVVFAIAVKVGMARAALDQLGLSAESAMLLLLMTVACRSVSLRLCTMRGGRQRLKRFPEVIQRAVLKWRKPFIEETAVALNVGGVLIPLGISLYELLHASLGPSLLWIASIFVVGVTQIVRRKAICGVRPFVLVAPVVALLLGWSLGAEHRAAFTYVSGFVGILAGADLLELHDLQNIGIREVVIGGDASFDAIFLNQMFSLLYC